MEKILILLRGTSGSGKSLLANLLAETFNGKAFAADDFFTKDGKYEWDAERLGEAHEWCRVSVENELTSGNGIAIVHNTMTSEKDVAPYQKIAEKHGAMLISLVVENRHGGTNVHGVPQATLENQVKKLLNSIKLI